MNPSPPDKPATRSRRSESACKYGVSVVDRYIPTTLLSSSLYYSISTTYIPRQLRTSIEGSRAVRAACIPQTHHASRFTSFNYGAQVGPALRTTPRPMGGFPRFNNGYAMMNNEPIRCSVPAYDLWISFLLESTYHGTFGINTIYMKHSR